MHTEYVLVRVYNAVTETDDEADAAFRDAIEGNFSDDIVISNEQLSKIVEMPDGGERHYSWNKLTNKWEITRYSMN